MPPEPPVLAFAVRFVPAPLLLPLAPNHQVIAPAMLKWHETAPSVAATLARSLPLLSVDAAPLPRPQRRLAPAWRLHSTSSPPASAPSMPAAKPALASAASPQGTGTPPALIALEGRISQAVQDAAVYPPTARTMHQQGRTQIRFDYQDGAVSAPEVAHPSAFAALDRAALLAVHRAAVPLPPPELAPRKLTLLVWVHFGLSSTE